MGGNTLVLVGAGALLAACGGLGSTAGTPAASGTSASPGRGAGSAVAGQVVQLSGGRMVVNGQAGSVTVTYDSSTSVLQSGAGSLADLTAGTCVTATGERAAGGGITATAVQALLNMNGQCTQPAGASPGAGAQGRGTIASPGQGRRPPGAASAAPTPANLAFVRGRVTAVAGSTITVQPAAGDAVAVAVPDTAGITRTVASTPARLAVGECVDAAGQRSSSGVLQARVLTIVPPGPNGCAGAGFFGPGGGVRPSASPR